MADGTGGVARNLDPFPSAHMNSGSRFVIGYLEKNIAHLIGFEFLHGSIEAPLTFRPNLDVLFHADQILGGGLFWEGIKKLFPQEVIPKTGAKEETHQHPQCDDACAEKERFPISLE